MTVPDYDREALVGTLLLGGCLFLAVGLAGLAAAMVGWWRRRR